jgi:hypothetical protein
MDISGLFQARHHEYGPAQGHSENFTGRTGQELRFVFQSALIWNDPFHFAEVKPVGIYRIFVHCF